MQSGIFGILKTSLALTAIILAIVGTLAIFGILTTEQSIDVSIKVAAVIGLFAAAFVLVGLLGNKDSKD